MILNLTLTPQELVNLISSGAGIVLSLLFAYVPGLSVWFANKSPEVKRLMMLAMVVVVGAAIGGLSCANLMDIVTCTQSGWFQIAQAIFSVAILSQTTYTLMPKSGAVRKAAAASKAKLLAKLSA